MHWILCLLCHWHIHSANFVKGYIKGARQCYKIWEGLSKIFPLRRVFLWNKVQSASSNGLGVLHLSLTNPQAALSPGVAWDCSLGYGDQMAGDERHSAGSGGNDFLKSIPLIPSQIQPYQTQEM